MSTTVPPPPSSVVYSRLLGSLPFPHVATMTDIMDRRQLKSQLEDAAEPPQSVWPPPASPGLPRLHVSHSMGVSSLLRHSRAIDYNVIISPNTYPPEQAIPAFYSNLSPKMRDRLSRVYPPPVPPPPKDQVRADPFRTLLVQYNRDTLDCCDAVAELLPGCHLHRAQGDHLSGLSGSGEVAEIIERWVQDMILGVLETPPKM